MQATYKKTDKQTPDGQDIYHRISGRGRPALCVKVGDRYKPWKRTPAKKEAAPAEAAPAEAATA